MTENIDPTTLNNILARLKSEYERELGEFRDARFPWYELEKLGRCAARHRCILALEEYQKNPEGHKEKLLTELRLERMTNISGRSTSAWENARKTEYYDGMWEAAEFLGYVK